MAFNPDVFDDSDFAPSTVTNNDVENVGLCENDESTENANVPVRPAVISLAPASSSFNVGVNTGASSSSLVGIRPAYSAEQQSEHISTVEANTSTANPGTSESLLEEISNVTPWNVSLIPKAQF